MAITGLLRTPLRRLARGPEIGTTGVMTLSSVFQLKYSDDGMGSAKQVEFRADDASSALAIAQEEAQGRKAELWRDGQMICTLRRSSETASFWEINIPN